MQNDKQCVVNNSPDHIDMLYSDFCMYRDVGITCDFKEWVDYCDEQCALYELMYDSLLNNNYFVWTNDKCVKELKNIIDICNPGDLLQCVYVKCTYWREKAQSANDSYTEYLRDVVSGNHDISERQSVC